MLHQKIGFIGVGNMGQAMLKAFIEKKVFLPRQISATNRSQGRLKKVADQFGITTFKNNEELIDHCDIVVLAMKPQDLLSALEPIASSFGENDVVISLAAGISLSSMAQVIPQTSRLVRVMPNTPLAVSKAVLGYCIQPGAEVIEPLVTDLLEPLGLAVAVEEGESFEALTVGCGSGTGFVFELMLYWQEWLEEHDFDPEVARAMTVQTFAGAAALAEKSSDIDLAALQSRVVSKKGVTAAGLQSMQELEVARALRYSFEKAVLRDRELGRPITD